MTDADWKAYCEWTNETAIYASAGEGNAAEMVYLGLAIAGEIGEYLEIIADGSKPISIQEELGDIFYYLARADMALVKFTKSKNGELSGLAMPPFLVPRDLARAAFDICNTTKKLLRDTSPDDTQRLATKLAWMYGEILFLAVQEAERPGVGVERILKRNVDKLNSRKARGVITGSGDSR